MVGFIQPKKDKYKLVQFPERVKEDGEEAANGHIDEDPRDKEHRVDEVRTEACGRMDLKGRVQWLHGVSFFNAGFVLLLPEPVLLGNDPMVVAVDSAVLLWRGSVVAIAVAAGSVFCPGRPPLQRRGEVLERVHGATAEGCLQSRRGPIGGEKVYRRG